MDEEEGRNSLGAYENMERSDIRPEFLSDDKEEKTDGAKEKLKAGESAAVNAGAKAAINAVTGGAGGAAMKAAEGAGAAKKSLSDNGDDGSKSGKRGKFSGKGNLKKAAPIAIIVCLIIVIYGVISFVGQWLYPFGFIARIREDWNSTKTSTTVRTDSMINTAQMTGDKSSKYGDVVFEDMGFTEKQIQEFADAGFEVRDDALVYGDTVIVPDIKVGVYNDGELAESGLTVQDSGSVYTGEELAEIKAEILADLGIAAEGGHVLGFSEAMKDWDIKEKYMIATRSYRGDVSGWYTSSAEITQQREGASRNNWKAYENTGNVAQNWQAVLEMADGKTYNVPESGEKTTKQLISEVADNSSDTDAALASAVEKTEGVANGEMVSKEIQAGSLWAEAIDKTKAGEGTGAPLSEMNNYIVQCGAADTESNHFLFGSGSLDTSDPALLTANPSVNSTVTVHANEDKEYRENHYTSNMNYKGKTGAIAKIGSAINKALNKLKSILGLGGGANADDVDGQMKSAIGYLDQARNQELFTNDCSDGAVLGESLVAALERKQVDKAQTAGQTTGNESATLAFQREQQEVIAEQAEFDRRTTSPFDITNQHTFLGSIMYSLIPMAVSTQSVSATTAVGNLGSLVSSAVSSLLPSSSAISDLELMRSTGDCATANSQGAYSDGHCIQYMSSDIDMIKENHPVEVFDEVADLRYDEKGYKIRYYDYYRNSSEEKAKASYPDYGDGPINEEENSMSAHWGNGHLPAWPAAKGTKTQVAHGCETNWYIETGDGFDGTVLGQKYFNYDIPLEWSYSRITNFAYDGFVDGWWRDGAEKAKNDEDPGSCELDFTERTSDKQPIINRYGALMAFITLSGQRGSGWGTADDGNLQFLVNSDFTKGRMHPCAAEQEDECEEYEKKYDGWNGEEGTAASKFISKYISGISYLMKDGEYTQDIANSIYKEDNRDKEMYNDISMEDNEYFWDEVKWYQAYTEMLDWLETIGKINQSSATMAVQDYWVDNPLDQSHAGIVARYSGMKTEEVLAVYRLADHLEFLAKYDPSDLGPLPVVEEEFYYESPEVVAQAEQAVQALGIVYDELRNRTVAA